jgi:hypothetical protein
MILVLRFSGRSLWYDSGVEVYAEGVMWLQSDCRLHLRSANMPRRCLYSKDVLLLPTITIILHLHYIGAALGK